MTGLKFAFSAAPFLVLVSPQPGYAQDPAQAFGQCLVMNTTGRERIDLMRWIVFGYATHPSVSDIISLPEDTLNTADQAVARLFEDLVTQRCLPEARSAIAAVGPQAFEIAFTALGEIAAIETMNDPGVQARMSAFTAYIDEDSFSAYFD